MEEVILTAMLRENTGVKGKLSALRKSGMIPAVIYGSSENPSHVSISEKDLLRILKSGKNAVVKINYANKQENVLLKDIQRDVVTDKVIHVDFQRISLTNKIEVKVPIKLTGEAYGVKAQGGIIEHNMRELTVRCLPVEIPKEIVVDITNLHIGNSIRIKDLKYENIEIKEDPEHIIASIIAPKEEKLQTISAQSTSGSEPEVIAKGKKEETTEAGATKQEAKASEPKKEEKADTKKQDTKK